MISHIPGWKEPKNNFPAGGSTIEVVKEYLLNLQENFCKTFEKEETSYFSSIEDQNVATARFSQDEWQYSSGGGGRTRILTQGKLLEQAGINFSHIFGESLPSSATAGRPELAGRHFQALGVSAVIHPRNPYIPTTHFNVRFIIAEKAQADPVWWFGGGFDLTPYYGFVEDCVHWHQTAKNACDPFGSDFFSKLKKWCDEYFYLKHRKEPRGIGGLFFDDLNEWGFDRCFAFLKSISEHFLLAYLPIVERRKNIPFSEKEREFQNYRRGRYVEFNLLYDRGTLFGLQSGGRTESILMSLPPHVSWRYNWQPEPGTPESELYEKFLVTKDWV